MRKSGERWKWNSEVINSSTRTKNRTLISLSKNVNNKTTEYKKWTISAPSYHKCEKQQRSMHAPTISVDKTRRKHYQWKTMETDFNRQNVTKTMTVIHKKCRCEMVSKKQSKMQNLFMLQTAQPIVSRTNRAKCTFKLASTLCLHPSARNVSNNAELGDILPPWDISHWSNVLFRCIQIRFLHSLQGSSRYCCLWDRIQQLTSSEISGLKLYNWTHLCA